FWRPRSHARRMPPRSRTWAKLRSTISPRLRMACLPTPDFNRLRLPYTAARASASPCQRKITLGGFRFGDAGLPGSAVERLETIARVISFVSHEVAGIFTRRRKTHGGEVLLRLFQCGAERRRVASLRRMDRRCHHHAGVQINRMLRLEGQMARAVLHPVYLRIGIGRARPILVRKLLALPLAIQSDQIVDRRRLDPTLFGHPRQHLSIGLATVAAHDSSQR